MPLPLQFRDCKAGCNPQVICPTGNLLTRVSSPLLKKSRFSADPNQFQKFLRPVLREGRWPSSRTLGWDAVDAAASGDARGWQGGSIRPVS